MVSKIFNEDFKEIPNPAEFGSTIRLPFLRVILKKPEMIILTETYLDIRGSDSKCLVQGTLILVNE